MKEPNFTCPICGNQKYFPPSQLTWRETCSMKCMGLKKKGVRRTASGINCIQCGKWRFVRPSVIKDRGARFCSIKCQGAWRKEHGIFAKENHPNWKGDDWTRLVHYIRTSTPYLRWLEAVRERANGICERCGKEGQDTHHTTPLEDFLADIFDPALGQFLCKDCHHESHAASTSK